MGNCYYNYLKKYHAYNAYKDFVTVWKNAYMSIDKKFGYKITDSQTKTGKKTELSNYLIFRNFTHHLILFP